MIGGSGGAGATTFACALGQWAARSGDAVVIDCDPQGPGLDRMLGVERRDGFRWDALCQTTGRLSARALREALPRSGALGVLSWYVDGRVPTLQAFAAREALSAARRGHAVVVVDLPRSPDALVDESRRALRPAARGHRRERRRRRRCGPDAGALRRSPGCRRGAAR
ncbi:hypothetical protein G5V59_15465 [Nocardioides sp. W3-2-3]|uniref:hypothetical protein n=1 Tax=Nocardioides convexus TaxID=2712224 RepID=UPI0024184401|nr:hypothetical protein [Nocardioides convexus]NHA00850.1 hypothetical protein [Nocardioides convexus]